MKCVLNKLDHSNAKPKFAETFVRCSIFAKDNVGMGIPATLCSHCCVKINQTLEQKKDLMFHGAFDYKEERARPGCVVQYLPDGLKPYAEAVLKAKKSFDGIAAECLRCREGINESIKAKTGTEITYIGQHGHEKITDVFVGDTEVIKRD
jgi:hypothetical protein